jgi:hypothetical protein
MEAIKNGITLQEGIGIRDEELASNHGDLLHISIIYRNDHTMDSGSAFDEQTPNFLENTKGIRSGTGWLYGTCSSDSRIDQPCQNPSEESIHAAN